MGLRLNPRSLSTALHHPSGVCAYEIKHLPSHCSYPGRGMVLASGIG